MGGGGGGQESFYAVGTPKALAEDGQVAQRNSEPTVCAMYRSWLMHAVGYAVQLVWHLNTSHCIRIGVIAQARGPQRRA
jgi:hypothetical protein